jgi:adenosylcobinamide-phosphate synthase
VSQAAFAHAAGVRLGGLNRYAGGWRRKPILATAAAPPDRSGVRRILALSRRLELLWLVGGTVLVAAVSVLAASA